MRTHTHSVSVWLSDAEYAHLQRRSVIFVLAFACNNMITLITCARDQADYATGDDPLNAINNLSEFIFAAIRAIGLILLGFGIVQIGLSMKSHDPSQRAQGFLTFFGGLIITFAKEILDLVMG